MVIDRYAQKLKGFLPLVFTNDVIFFFVCQALGLSIDAEKLKGFWRLVFTNDIKFVATGGASGFAGIMQCMRPYATSA